MTNGFKRLNSLIFSAAITLVAAGCGMTHSNYVNYNSPSGSGQSGGSGGAGGSGGSQGGSTLSASCQSAATAWTTNMATVVNNTCSGCHSSLTPSLNANQDDANRKAIKQDPQFANLSTFLFSGNHQGASTVSGKVTAAQVSAWVSAEQQCN